MIIPTVLQLMRFGVITEICRVEVGQFHSWKFRVCLKIYEEPYIWWCIHDDPEEALETAVNLIVRFRLQGKQIVHPSVAWAIGQQQERLDFSSQ